ncbi:hypothetical protein PHISP_04348 [Aspergillus sp. HF37]|nr:hypothetical protein PHISP_04348 [Aspergillus sp. HF37]
MHHRKENNNTNFNNTNALSSTPPSANPLGLCLSTSFRPAGSDCSVSPLSSAATSPTSSPPTSPFRRGQYCSLSRSPDGLGSRSQSPFRLSSSARCSSLALLRHRPSSIDLALSEERTRCDGDSIERQGLNLMEPRPVDPVTIPMNLDTNVFPVLDGSHEPFQSMNQVQDQGQAQAENPQHPRFVMGGIFEVMEGSA